MDVLQLLYDKFKVDETSVFIVEPNVFQKFGFHYLLPRFKVTNPILLSFKTKGNVPRGVDVFPYSIYIDLLRFYSLYTDLLLKSPVFSHELAGVTRLNTKEYLDLIINEVYKISPSQVKAKKSTRTIINIKNYLGVYCAISLAYVFPLKNLYDICYVRLSEELDLLLRPIYNVLSPNYYEIPNDKVGFEAISEVNRVGENEYIVDFRLAVLFPGGRIDYISSILPHYFLDTYGCLANMRSLCEQIRLNNINQQVIDNFINSNLYYKATIFKIL